MANHFTALDGNGNPWLPEAEEDASYAGDFFDDGDDDPRCICDGSGTVVTCIDDMCRGLGECIHGDGEEICPAHF